MRPFRAKELSQPNQTNLEMNFVGNDLKKLGKSEATNDLRFFSFCSTDTAGGGRFALFAILQKFLTQTSSKA